jgi:isoleucyl-tRNA synthetase
LILSETNIKDIEYITDTVGFITKKIKPNFKALGPKVGKSMKQVAEAITNLDQESINILETKGEIEINVQDQTFLISSSDLEIIAEDIPGWQVSNMGNLTVALDVTITPELKLEGLSRELINRIQNLRKELGFEVTDRITVQVQQHELIATALMQNKEYICSEILADDIILADNLVEGNKTVIDDVELQILLIKK